MKKIEDILTFWFGDFEELPAEHIRQSWWKKEKNFDNKIKENFEGLLINAVDGGLEKWKQMPRGVLAFIILLDQFSRNMYRDTPRAFSQDGMALSAALEGMKKSLDKELKAVERQFFYMPLMHCEDIKIQKLSMETFSSLAEEFKENKKLYNLLYNNYKFSVRHHDIIERFGRYPHRNEILGRKTTDEEKVFLKEKWSSF